MPHRSHYLKTELYDLIQSDPAIFEFLQEGSLDGIWYWDIENPRNEWMSERFWQVLGYEPSEKDHDPESWQDIINQDDLALALENFKRHCDDPSHPYDQIVRYRHSDGHEVTIRCRGLAIRDADGKALRMLGAHSDITQFVDARIAEEARRRAESANRAKTTFLANISHEIRTPLNSMLLIAQTLQASQLTAGQTGMVNDLLLAGEQMNGLLGDLIDISKIESGEISIENEVFSSRDLLEAVAATLSSGARGKGLALSIQLDLGASPVVVGGLSRIRQVLINLLSNAIKFTEQGRITLASGTEAHEEAGYETLVIRVIDTGPGVPDAIKDVIFDRYQRSDSDDDLSIPGVGIGLSISKTICEAHGGRLTVEDARGGGAEFVARFRVRTETGISESDDGDAGTALPALPRGLRIMVAEDVMLNRKSLKHLLASEEIELTFATTGTEALRLLKEKTFDVALIDLRMPGMNGLEVVREYRRIEKERGSGLLHIVACSAHVLKGQKANYRDAGFDGFLVKPLKKSELWQALDIGS